jgi:signal transduction histidine kinase
MWRLPLFSLVRRIIVSVALCLTLILAMYLLVALWTINESSEAAFRERVTLAKVLAERIDEVLGLELLTLQAEAATLVLSPPYRLAEVQGHRLASLIRPLGDFNRVSVADANGDIIWTNPADEAPGSPAVIDQQRLQAFRATGQPEIIQVIVGRSTYVRLVVPVADPDGGLAGALIAELDPADVGLGLLPRRSIDGGVIAQLMDAEGRQVVGAGIPGPRGAREHAFLMADLVRTQTPGYRIHEPGPDAPYARHVVAYAPVTRLPVWGVAVEQPIDDVLAMPRQLERRLATTGVASFALIIALAWFDVRRVVRPLKRLTEAAERIASGRLDEPLLVARNDELGVLARAFETMRLQLQASRAKVQSLAILEERERIAREMHDGLGQVLGYVNTKALAVARLLEVGKVEEARTQVTQLEAAAKEVYADVREAILGLHTTLNPERDFRSALREYIVGFQQQSGVQVGLDVSTWPDPSPLPLAAEIQLVRIVQEALANVRKHAHARHAIVQLTSQSGAVQLSITDDGRGFDPARLDRDGWPRFGLQTMRERAEGIGGAFAIDSHNEAGTRVLISVPARGTPVGTSAEVSYAANARTPG